MRYVLPSIVLLAALGCSVDPGPSGDVDVASRTDIDLVLDDFHSAAAAADEERYFGHFAPEGVFLGTDDGERWTVEEFRSYVHPHFAAGNGWTYVSSERHVTFSPDRRTAWFDEKLDNEKYGRTRGSGVLRRTPAGWKIAHYNLSFTIPNDIAADAVALIRAGTAEPD